ncbi:MAG: acyl-CoA dehydrogenase family protein [Acidimicrobiia bacterium]|nr:acyl-CoA dehydrogenase family protein [Acidimicrobiia bacterium]
MAISDYEPDLTEEEKAICDTVHRFAEEVMRPAGVALDAMPDPADVIAPGSVVYDVFKRYHALGVDMIGTTSTDLTPAQQARLRCIIAEELGWGDAGLAISLGVSGFPRMLAMLTGNADLIARVSSDDMIGCWPITEPDHGSDTILYLNRPKEVPGTPNCVAVKDGDSFVIRGQKSAWVSNGTIATDAALFCSVDMGDGENGTAAFVVPLDLDGVKRGKPLDKLGQRALNQGEIFFDDVRVPADHMVIPSEMMGFGGDMVLSQANGGMGSIFVGVAQAALDLAVEYAKTRVQGGIPIIEHQSVKGRLFEMFRKVEAARALNRRTILLNTLQAPPRLEMAIASKVTSTSTAFEVASAALQIFGGNGLSREYPIEKILRDARASMIEDGCNEVLSLVGATRL